jgi:uncharacterized protein (DUF58 family)
MKLIRNLYLTPVFFWCMATVIVMFVAAFVYPEFDLVARYALAGVALLILLDVLLLFLPGYQMEAEREVASKLSLGDEQIVKISVRNNMNSHIRYSAYEEAPFQLQMRDLKFHGVLVSGDALEYSYTIKPTTRGKYEFGNIILYLRTIIGIVERRIVIKAAETVAVYPSVIKMRQYELKVFNKLNLSSGIKRVRRLGHSTEFEQIKNYVAGDDYRSVNWKATSRKNELMVNQYEDEKAQQIYCIIDKSRVMQQAFGGLTLLDHAINSTLVLLNIALRKGDRAGLLTFSDKLGSRIPAERTPTQLKKIQDVLYRQRTRFLESNYELLYSGVRQYIKGRSLVILFTNFETKYAIERSLPLLRKINSTHLLVVVFFENTGLRELARMESKTLRDVYTQTISENIVFEKQLIVEELRKHAIQTILTTPDKLSVDTINKYLELKSRGMI